MASNNDVDDWEDVPVHAGANSGADDWQDVPTARAPQHQAPSTGTAALKGFGQGLTFGFGDELGGAEQAGLSLLAKHAPRLADALGIESRYSDELGSTGDIYRQGRDENRQEIEEAKAAHPTAFGIGDVAGNTVTSLLLPGGQAAKGAQALSLGAKMAKGAKMGAALGAVSGFGNSDADLTQGDVGGAALDTAIGAGIGGAMGGLVPVGEKYVLQPVGRGIAKVANKAADAMGGFAERRAVKAVIPMLKDYRAMGADKVQEMGRDILDADVLQGRLGIPRNVDEIHPALDQAKQAVGKRIGDARAELEALRTAQPQMVPLEDLDQVPAKVWDKGRLADIMGARRAGKELPPVRVGRDPRGNWHVFDGNHRIEAARMERDPEILAAIDRAVDQPGDRAAVEAFNPHRLAQRVEDELIRPIANSPGDRRMVARLQSEANAIRRLQPDAEVPFDAAQVIKQGYDKGFDSARSSEFNEANRAIYNLARQEEDRAARAVADTVGRPQVADQFLEAKRLYSNLTPAEQFAEDQFARRQANRMFSPTDYAAALAQSRHEGGLGNGVMDALWALGHKQIRERGSSAAAVGADAVSRALKTNPETFGKYAAVLSNAAARSPQSLAALDLVLSQKDPEYRRTKQQATGMDVAAR